METKTRFIETATRLFAERGYYGVSIAAVANELALTKQALLHHFGSKEKLYGEVLQTISNRLMEDMSRIVQASENPREGFEACLMYFYDALQSRPDDTLVLMRELLDNKQRAENAKTWYLKPFLDSLCDMALAASPKRLKNQAQAFVVVYQILGAMKYFLVSEPTLVQMFGSKNWKAFTEHYEPELRALIAARLD
ncbi:AcrR family transcriptional regulator [Litorivivens lipolytica]|uniref:AcrR family transcriptional regulator n=1 Tax=Litorivivens lipolytica TaxID=1524264 RepID=A0A7W4Z7B3_9GAMM|nr:TetR/AcrR family transcriptional regulator [Litorivivens lipolytica]MBB3047855.1 AcrR family transcriptional regulator [Litorivivens lipolytica]